MSITVEELKHLKKLLERDMKNLINGFEHKTNVRVLGVTSFPDPYNVIGSPPTFRITVEIEI